MLKILLLNCQEKLHLITGSPAPSLRSVKVISSLGVIVTITSFDNSILIGERSISILKKSQEYVGMKFFSIGSEKKTHEEKISWTISQQKKHRMNPLDVNNDMVEMSSLEIYPRLKGKTVVMYESSLKESFYEK